MLSFYTFMTALFTSLLMVPFLRRWALERGELDQPDQRKQHTMPMPRLGGIAIFLSFLFSAIVFVPISNCTRGILAGGLIIFVTGLLDDMRGLSAKQKFVGEIIACLTGILIGNHYLVSLGDLFGFGEILLPIWLGIPFTVFAVVGVINAINLIDGLDGLAGGVSMLALSAFFVFGLLNDDMTTMLLSAALIGGILGFLKYNFYPARIFMGDAGSLTVGFILGFLAIHVTQHPSSEVSPVVPLLILGVPIIDTIWVMSRRVLNGHSPFVPDRTHMHHRFLNLGFEHRFTVLIIYGLTTFWVFFAVLDMQLPDYVLFYGFLVLNMTGYLVLNRMQHRIDLKSKVMKDTDESLRNSVIFGRLSALADYSVPVIQGGLAVFALVTVYVMTTHSDVDWQIVCLLLLSGLGIKIWGGKDGQFIMLVVYAATALAAYEVWSAESDFIIGIAVKQVGDVLIGLMLVLSCIKFILRKPSEFFLTTVDFLVLALCVTTAVASHVGAFNLSIAGPLLRFVLLLFAIRTVLTRKGNTLAVVSNATLVFLLMLLLWIFLQR